MVSQITFIPKNFVD